MTKKASETIEVLGGAVLGGIGGCVAAFLGVGLLFWAVGGLNDVPWGIFVLPVAPFTGLFGTGIGGMIVQSHQARRAFEQLEEEEQVRGFPVVQKRMSGRSARPTN